MASDAIEELSNESQHLYSETADSDSLITDVKEISEELFPGIISESDTFVKSKIKEAEDSISPTTQLIIEEGWFPELAIKFENAVVFESLGKVVGRIMNNFPTDRLQVTKEVQEEFEVKDIYMSRMIRNSRVNEEVRKVLRTLFPELMMEFETTEEFLEGVVGVYPESRIHMFLDSIDQRRERENAYWEFCRLSGKNEAKVLQSLDIRWRNYRVLQKIYSELLEDPDTLTLKVPQKEIDKLKDRYGRYPGLIRNPELVKELSNLELFSLIYTLGLSAGNMRIGNALGRNIGIVRTVERVRGEKFNEAKRFLMYEVKRRLDKDSTLIDTRFFGEVFILWFCAYKKFFTWRDDNVSNYEDLRDALDVELLMRAAKKIHEEGKQENGIAELLPKKDAWREYVLEDRDLEIMRRLQ
jgi:hypothetical protein